jgi:hypothetical protein
LKEEGDFGSCGPVKLANSRLVGPQQQKSIDMSPRAVKIITLKISGKEERESTIYYPPIMAIPQLPR